MKKSGKAIIILAVIVGICAVAWYFFGDKVISFWNESRANKAAWEQINAQSSAVIDAVEDQQIIVCESELVFEDTGESTGDWYHKKFIIDNEQGLVLKIHGYNPDAEEDGYKTIVKVDEPVDEDRYENSVYNWYVFSPWEDATDVFDGDLYEHRALPVNEWVHYQYRKDWFVYDGTSYDCSYAKVKSAKRIEEIGPEECNGVPAIHYVAYVRPVDLLYNKEKNGTAKSFYKLYGIPSEIDKNYPEAYEVFLQLMEDYQSTEMEMHYWLDEEGRLIRIEKDSTAVYYEELCLWGGEDLAAWVEDPEIREVKSIQNYLYNEEDMRVEIPEEFIDVWDYNG